jgi:hypothetical protein
LTYNVTDPAGNSGTGVATLTIGPPTTPTAPQFTTGSQITNALTPVIAGTALRGSTVTLFANGLVVGSGTADATTGVFAITPGMALPLGLDSLTVTTTTVGGVSAASTPISLFALPTPVGGTSTADFSSADLGAVLTQGGHFAFVGGTEAVQLTDGILSVGPDTNEAALQRLYEGLLGRSADAGGISNADSQLSAGVSQGAIADGLVNSAEYAADHGVQTDQQFVDTLYQGLLGRPASEDTQSSYWTMLLSQGVSRGTIAAGVADTAEAKAHLAAATAQVFVPSASGTLAHELYETGLGREVDLPGLAGFQAAAATQTPSQLAAGLAGSAEFATDHAGQSNAAFVNSLYEAGIGRAADPSGSSFWTGLLDGGTSRGDVLLGIATSSDAAAHLTHNLSA